MFSGRPFSLTAAAWLTQRRLKRSFMMRMTLKWLRMGALHVIVTGTAMVALAQSLPATPESQPTISTLPSANSARYLCVSQLQRAQSAIRRQDFASAMEVAKAGLSTCPEQRDLLLTLADAEMLSHNFDASIQTLHALLAKTPDDVAALLLLGQTQYLNAHDQDAAASFQRAIKAAPRSPEPHYWLGRLDYADGNVPKAMQEFEKAIQLDQSFYRAYDNLGLCYEALGENGHAMENYVQALKLVYKDHPEYDDVYLNMAGLMLKLGNSQKAFDLAAEATKRNPRNPKGFFLAGKALDQAGQYDTSVKWLKQAVEMDPKYPDPHYILARVYRREGKLSDADREMADFKALQDKAPEVKR